MKEKRAKKIINNLLKRVELSSNIYDEVVYKLPSGIITEHELESMEVLTGDSSFSTINDDGYLYHSTNKFPEFANSVKVDENFESNGIVESKDTFIGPGQDYSNRDEVY